MLIQYAANFVRRRLGVTVNMVALVKYRPQPFWHIIPRGKKDRGRYHDTTTFV